MGSHYRNEEQLVLMKKCAKCEIEKSTKTDFYGHSLTKDGFHNYCKDCLSLYQEEFLSKNKQKIKERDKKRKRIYNAKPEVKERLKEKNLKQYGLSLDSYEEMLKKQDFKCKICNKQNKSVLAVDHDHKTGRIRGLLCFSCNVILGNAKDDEKILLKSIEYLRNSNEYKS